MSMQSVSRIYRALTGQTEPEPAEAPVVEEPEPKAKRSRKKKVEETTVVVDDE
jgi:hypothetical protein